MYLFVRAHLEICALGLWLEEGLDVVRDSGNSECFANGPQKLKKKLHKNNNTKYNLITKYDKIQSLE